MPSPRLFEALVIRCKEHGITVTMQDDLYDTMMVLMMRMLDYVEEARKGILIAKGARSELLDGNGNPLR